MRTLWALILFGSLIIHHCFTTTSGEAVPKDAQPSLAACKPYVDAALKGDIPSEPPQEVVPEETKDSSGSSEEGDGQDNDATNETLAPDDGSIEAPEETRESESSEENSGKTTHKGGSEEEDGSSESDHEEPEINGLEVEDEEETKVDSNTTKEDSSEETSEEAPPPPAPIPPKEPQSSTKTKAEEPQKQSESDESDEDNSGKPTPEAPSPKTPQRDGASSHPVADDSDESREFKNPEPKVEKKVSNPTKESKEEIKKPESEESSEESVEEEVVISSKKEKATSKGRQGVGDDKFEEVKTPTKKSKKVIEESEEDETEVRPKSSKSHSKEPKPAKKAVESTEDVSQESSEESSYQPRSRENLIRILGLDDTTDLKQKTGLLDKVTQQTLKELKSTYEYAIKPLETLYKYRDLSNRHFGDPEIFSKPMVVFMGPWSGGKSTIINWLLGIQTEEHALRTGADPSPAQFNILTHGSEEEVLDGTQLAADWTFSGLQKFGQSFLDRLRGRKLPNRLLEKVNLVEIPGILEIRKQVERSFPFNDACQWFIDRADVLFLVYDPAKLDIGPETEAILDQLKGRESQVRIVLNKADTVKPDELLRVQATLIWNISPLMASAEPPVLYVASLWDRPLQPEAPASLLNAHENLFLKDISDATDKRVETRIAAARRFAVRVRNHAKMCDCYLNTYNNHRSFFSNKKRISDDIIDHPQNYHIYEGLSTLTNISRYDLPDPDSYRDFFRLNPIWEFPTLASTCTYFRGCPINKLDVAIAYDLPELLGRYRRQRESIVTAPTGTLPDIKLKEVQEKKDTPIDIPKGKSRWYKLPPEEQMTDDKTGKQKSTPPAAASPPVKEATQEKPKPKNKWWKEVPEAVVKVEPQKEKEKVKKEKKSEEMKPMEPKEGYIIVQPKNKFWKPYYEPIKPKEEEVKPKKNKWYKT